VCSVLAVFLPERAYIFVALTVSDLSLIGFGGIYDMSRASTNMILKLRITILTILVLHFPSPLGIFSSNWIFLLVQDIKRRKHKKNSFFSFGSIAPYLSVESAFLSYASWMKK
jgi:hypothetical protein